MDRGPNSRVDGGLRITVGNDVYYERGRSPVRRSPGGDLRNRLGPRPPDYGPRIPDPRHDSFHNKPPHMENIGHWLPPSDGKMYGWPPHDMEQRSPNHHHRDRMSPRRYEREIAPRHRQSSRSPPQKRNGSYLQERRRSPSYHRSRSPSHRSKSPRHSQRRRSTSSEESPRRDRSHRENRIWDQERGLPNVPSLREADDLLIAMYSKSEKESQKSYEKRSPRSEPRSKAYINPAIVSDEQKLSAFTQAYAKTSPQSKQYPPEHSDDEDRFLYGNNNARKRVKSKSHHKDKTKEAEAKEKKIEETKSKSDVTPGGFDTNALKNVLKAIGFDFEMSAQSANKTAKDTDLKTKTEKPVVETRSVPSHKKASSSQPVESIVVGSKESPIPVVPTVVAKVPPYSQSDPTQVYQQAYQQAVQYQAAGFAAPQVQGQPVYLYQTPAGLVQLPQMAVSSLNQPVKAEPSRSNLKVITTTAADKNEKPEKMKSSKELESEKKFRKQRLNYLEEELNKLRKQQTDLIQRKRKQKGDHELMNQNTILQAGVERQIKEIRGSSETQSESSSESNSSGSEDSRPVFNYVDKGFHICSLCNITFDYLPDYLAHLLSKSHRKLENPENRPWARKKQKKNKPTSKNAINVPMSGVEFLFPIHGFYCSVCKVFCGDKSDGEEHCFSNSHNKAYAKFLKKNPLYEKPTQKSVKKSKKDKKEEKWEEKKIVIRKEVKSPSNESYKSNQDNGRKSQSFTAADRRAFERAPDEIRPVPPPQYLKSPPRSCVERDSHSPPPPQRDQYISRDEKSRRRFEERSPSRKRVRDDRSDKKRWSPGYDQFEQEREMQPPNPEPPKSSGIKFTKFTWKRTQKDDANGKEPPKTQKTEDEEKPKLQMKLKTTSTQLRNIGKVRTGLSSKVPNFAPHTRVISKTQFRGTQQPQHNPGNNVSVSTFLAASKKSIPAVPPSAPMEKPEPPKEPPPPTPKPPSIITKIENKEPPPPGTEEIENDGAESDASGISMELASDED